MFNGLKVKFMKKVLFFAAMALVALASCSDETFIGDVTTAPQDNSPSETNAIVFASATQGVTRAGELVGATAAEKLGGMFVVEGTKGSEQTNSPSTTVVFDNYLVGYEYNHAGKTESDTHNWEYVGKESGITSSTIGSASASDRMTGSTWTSLHSGTTDAKSQTIKYWDYSVDQYDFIAWSTGNLEAVKVAPTKGSTVQVTRINKGASLASEGFKMTALSAADLLQCYYTDINTVTKASSGYGQPVTLTFRNMAAKVRIALYETVPGYSVKDVKFYSAESDDANTAGVYDPTDLATDASKTTTATLFTTGSDRIPQSGEIVVYYPRIGITNRDGDATANPAILKADDYNKAQVTVNTATGGDAGVTTQTFGTLTAQYSGKEANEEDDDIYLGRTLPTATFAGDAADAFYQAVIPNTSGKPLTLRVDYTLVSTDGSAEVINVYGAKAVVPSTYTNWLPNYAYTYIFKISDNTNGWTSQTATDPQGLFPITFDAVVTSFIDANAEQTTVTTVASPSITTYQQGHKVDVSTNPHTGNNEYSKSQKAGSSDDVKDLYVQVMDNSTATPSLVKTLSAANSLLYKITKSDADYPKASEAEVMDALQNRTDVYSNDAAATPIVGRNGVKLTKDATNISNTVISIINGVDDQPITVASGSAAKIDIDQLAVGTYAYVYASTTPGSDKKVYHIADGVTDATSAANYYEIKPTDISATSDAIAQNGKVYFVKNVDATGAYVSYTFKQTKVGVDSVSGLYEATIPSDKGATTYSDNNFYFDVYYQNNGVYAVKVIKVVN